MNHAVPHICKLALAAWWAREQANSNMLITPGSFEMKSKYNVQLVHDQFSWQCIYVAIGLLFGCYHDHGICTWLCMVNYDTKQSMSSIVGCEEWNKMCRVGVGYRWRNKDAKWWLASPKESLPAGSVMMRRGKAVIQCQLGWVTGTSSQPMWDVIRGCSIWVWLIKEGAWSRGKERERD